MIRLLSWCSAGALGVWEKVSARLDSFLCLLVIGRLVTRTAQYKGSGHGEMPIAVAVCYRARQPEQQIDAVLATPPHAGRISFRSALRFAFDRVVYFTSTQLLLLYRI